MSNVKSNLYNFSAEDAEDAEWGCAFIYRNPGIKRISMDQGQQISPFEAKIELRQVLTNFQRLQRIMIQTQRNYPQRTQKTLNGVVHSFTGIPASTVFPWIRGSKILRLRPRWR